METIGIRDLKAHASHILRRVREAGAAYTVTHHGRAVARITPPDDTAPEQSMATGDPAYVWLTGRHWTDAQYLLFANDQNAFIELSDGRVRVQAMPTPRHQTIVFDLAVGLRASALGKVFIAPLPVRLGPGKFREPDVMFYLHDHLHRVGEQHAGPPDVAIEILSSSTRPLDLVDKPDSSTSRWNTPPPASRSTGSSTRRRATYPSTACAIRATRCSGAFARARR